ncbi:MAG: phosphate ABC transporter permease subunit PstC [Deltaproteobacteria bacterium]|nr:phosphate ABC transporter permease subunit PstC [Deltaproteobacteria bacterium]
MRQLQKIKEWFIEKALFLSALFSVFVTIGIIGVLIFETFEFFKVISIFDFLTDTQWTPLFSEKHFGILPLFAGTFLTTIIAMAVSLPIGVITAIYLSEYSSENIKGVVKPILEVLAAVPTVVYGYFALLFVTPLLQRVIPDMSGFNSLAAGIVMGVMIIPIISSLSEDAMHAVPMSLREGALALGSTKLQVALKVILPAAFSGIAASFILGISRAIGETMIVAIAAGQQPRLTLNPLVPIETVTAYIVQVSLGDTPTGTIEYSTIFAAGMSLFIVTFVLNIVSYWLKKRFREVYE